MQGCCAKCFVIIAVHCDGVCFIGDAKIERGVYHMVIR